jgi:hypothetical protein
MAFVEGGCLVLRTPRFLAVALPVVLVVAAQWLRPHTADPSTVPHPTIEPSLPLTLDLRVLPADPDRGEPEHLEATIVASSDLQDVSLSLVLPEGVEGDDTAFPAGDGQILHRGERRIVPVPLRTRSDGEFPIRLLATFRLPDGRHFRTEQGILWRSSGGGPAGRYHAGAYEWMGVPVAEPQP